MAISLASCSIQILVVEKKHEKLKDKNYKSCMNVKKYFLKNGPGQEQQKGSIEHLQICN